MSRRDDGAALARRGARGRDDGVVKHDERPRILVVEDDCVDMLAIQRLAKAKALPWDLIPAYSLAEAQNCLSRERFDLVLLDHVLPDGYGTELLDRLGDLPAIVVASDRGPQFRADVIRRGARGFVTKRLGHAHVPELTAVVAAVLAPGSPPGA
jgi:CheY-like chemotaxis protein